MALTNNNNLPEIFLDAMKYDTHRMAGDISCTQLIDSPQIRMLFKKHRPDKDVSEGILALMGTAVHHVLERANIKSVRGEAFKLTIESLEELASKTEDKEQIAKIKGGAGWLKKVADANYPVDETRFLTEKTLTEVVDGMSISMTFDRYDKQTKTLYDYKMCSTYMFTEPEARSKWEGQTNVYAWGLRKAGYEVENIKICAIFRDWSKFKAQQSPGYPSAGIVEVEIKVQPNEIMQKAIERRVKLHQQAELGNILDCTPTERWASATTYAVMQTGSNRAIRVFPDEAVADEFIKTKQRDFEKPIFKSIRHGVSRRCDSYCSVRDFCEQRKRMLIEQTEK